MAVNTLAVTETGKVTLYDAFPLASVVTLVKPRNVSPSPKPLPLPLTPLKNSSRKVVLAVLLSAPLIVTLPPEIVTVLMSWIILQRVATGISVAEIV